MWWWLVGAGGIAAAEALLKMRPEMLESERGKNLRTVVKRIVVRKGVRWRELFSTGVHVEFLW